MPGIDQPLEDPEQYPYVVEVQSRRGFIEEKEGGFGLRRSLLELPIYPALDPRTKARCQ